MPITQPFLSGDWGSSSLRIRLVDPAGLRVIAEERSNQGIASSFFLWRQTGSADPAKRVSFYLDIIRKSIKAIETRLPISLQGVPLILSGMASSSAGILELPYRELPFAIDEKDLIIGRLEPCDDFAHPVLLISGLKSRDDVMRGEETQLIGCLQGTEPVPGAEQDEPVPGDGLYIFPGTHSKHILVKGRTIVDFKTYMTGEFFELLSEKSLLSGSVEKNTTSPEGRSSPAADGQSESYWQDAQHLKSFQQGVQDAIGANLLHAAFRVRTNQLLGVLSKKENFHYLSGLLIGTELQSLYGDDATNLYLCCGASLKDYYEKALEATNLCKRVHIFPDDWIDSAVVRGQYRIFSQYGR